MTTAAGGRPALGVTGFYQPAMAYRTIAVISFAQRRTLIFLALFVAFFTAELFTFHINQQSAFFVRHVVANTAAIGLQGLGMNIVGEFHRRAPQLAENIFVRQGVLRLLGY